MNQDALIGLIAGGGLLFALKGSGSASQQRPNVVAPIAGGAAPGQSGGGAGNIIGQVVGAGVSIGTSLLGGGSTTAGAGAAGGTATAGTSSAAAPAEAALLTAGGVSVGAIAVVALWIIAIIVAVVSSAAIMGAKWIQQKIRELNTRAIPNMYETEFAMLREMLDKGGYTYEISDVRDTNFDWQDRSQSQGTTIKITGFRKILRNVKYQGSPVKPINMKYLCILVRLLSYTYTFWLCAYGRNAWNTWGSPTGQQDPNFADGEYFAEVWGVPLCNGQPNDAIYESAVAAFDAVNKPGLLSFSQMRLGMQAQAIIAACKVVGFDGGQRGTHLMTVLGLTGQPGVRFTETTVYLNAPVWGQYNVWYDFSTNRTYTDAPK